MRYGDDRVIALACPPIDVSTVLKGMGMPAGPSASNPALCSIVEETIVHAQKNLLTPRALIVRLPASTGSDDGTVLGSRQAHDLPAHYLEGADGVVLVVTTIGSALEVAISQHMCDGDSLSAMVLDVLGSQSVLEAASYARSIVEDELAEEGVGVGAPIEPGTGDVGLPLLGSLFSLADLSTIGMSLNDSFLMAPVKSVCELIPFGERLGASRRGCASCVGCADGGCQSCRVGR